MAKINKLNFESESTQFLRSLEQDAKNNVSSARDAEQIKYNRINKLRDEVQKESNMTKVWAGF